MMDSLPVRKGELVRQGSSEKWMVYVSKTDSLHLLNATARAIWELCDGHTSPIEMAHAISELTALSPTESIDQVNLALKTLRRSGLIEERAR
jgi:hypothetical protein